MAESEDVYELDQLAVQPGTYFNPQTEVVIVVDDSASVDQDLFDDPAYEGAEWVRISDEVPVDEAALEEALDGFQGRGGSPTTAAEEGIIEDEDNPELEPDEDLDE